MKNIIRISLAAIALIMGVACEKEDHAVNQMITTYPEISLDGGSPYAFQVGSAFVDPGYTATLAGEDVTSDVVVDGEVDGTASGVYTLYYSFTNDEGFTSTVSRSVVVYDIANAGSADISGNYSDTNISWYTAAGDYVNSYNAAYGFSYPMKILAGPAAGLFYVEDLLCGLYPYYAGYGSAYAYKAFILLNADNTINILNGDEIDPWGDAIADFDGVPSTYDPATGDVVLNWDWGTGRVYRTTYKK